MGVEVIGKKARKHVCLWSDVPIKGGEVHRVCIAKSGSLFCFNHSKVHVRRSLILGEFGDADVCPCIRVYKQLRDFARVYSDRSLSNFSKAGIDSRLRHALHPEQPSGRRVWRKWRKSGRKGRKRAWSDWECLDRYKEQFPQALCAELRARGHRARAVDHNALNVSLNYWQFGEVRVEVTCERRTDGGSVWKLAFFTTGDCKTDRLNAFQAYHYLVHYRKAYLKGDIKLAADRLEELVVTSVLEGVTW